MATQTLKNVILQLRTGSATQWAASTRILAVGEPGVETDSGRIKIGDGTNLWPALPWSGAAIVKSGTNGALTVNGADVVVYSLPTATSYTLGGHQVIQWDWKGHRGQLNRHSLCEQRGQRRPVVILADLQSVRRCNWLR